jgi:carbamoyl-phosphate synthase large subunit
MVNILLTSVGRRAYLVDYFKQALNGNGKVICTNMYSDVAGMYAGDIAVVTPASWDGEYISFILELCRKYHIDLIFSLHDVDVFFLSQHIDELKKTGAFPVLPSPEFARIALDKYESTLFLKKNGILAPWSSIDIGEAILAIEKNEVQFPLVIKARRGFGSLALEFCQTKGDLKSAFYRSNARIAKLLRCWKLYSQPEKNIIIQEQIAGKEYCVNIINDLAGRYACHFICQVESMRAGETDMVTTVDPDFAGTMPYQLSRVSEYAGPCGVDCIMDENGRLYVIDINPRFSGDYPFHQICGANIPAAMIHWFQGKSADPSWLNADIGVRCFKDLTPKKNQCVA